MKASKYIAASALAFCTFGLQSCLDYMDPGQELGPNEITDDDVIYQGEADKLNYRHEITEAGFDSAATALNTKFAQALGGEYAMCGGKEAGYPGAHAYQRMFSLGPDCYAQYFVVPHHDFMYGTLTSTYAVSRDFNPGPFGAFEMVKNAIVPLINHPLIDSIPEMKAINLLLFNISSQQVADLYGPFPYVDYKGNKVANPFEYNDLRSIYTNIEANVDSIVNCLNYFVNRPDWYKARVMSLIGQHTRLTQDWYNPGEDLSRWVRLANSLKLRMAMHLTKVDPEMAQKWAEEAVASGVIEAGDQQAMLQPAMLGFDHPLLVISNSWGDIRLSASFESLLKSLNHPYVNNVFARNSAQMTHAKTREVTPADSLVVGMREGIPTGIGQSADNNPQIGYSGLTPENIVMAPIYVMKWAEVDFLRAEGALRGWNMGGTAEFFYNRGIENADLEDPMITGGNGFYQQGLADYMAQESATEFTYKDPLGSTPDMPSVTKIGVKWNEADSREIKLEKIITQKYIAIFPFSYEAWTDLRRTGYPRLFPVLNPQDGDGSLNDGDLIRRMPFPGYDDASLLDIQTTGLKALGGSDQQGTRLWWDIDAPNF